MYCQIQSFITETTYVTFGFTRKRLTDIMTVTQRQSIFTSINSTEIQLSSKAVSVAMAMQRYCDLQAEMSF